MIRDMCEYKRQNPSIKIEEKLPHNSVEIRGELRHKAPLLNIFTRTGGI